MRNQQICCLSLNMYMMPKQFFLGQTIFILAIQKDLGIIRKMAWMHLVTLLYFITPIVSFSTIFRSTLDVQVVSMSDDGNTLICLDKRAQKAQITVFKKIALTYQTIKVKDMYGYVPLIFSNYHQLKFYNLNKPLLNQNGSQAYFVSGLSGFVTKVSLKDINVANPRFTVLNQYGIQFCQPFKCLFSYEKDFLSLFDTEQRKLFLFYKNNLVFNTILQNIYYNLTKSAGFQKISDSELRFSIYSDNALLFINYRININPFIITHISTNYDCFFARNCFICDSLRTTTYYLKDNNETQGSNGYVYNSSYIYFYDLMSNYRGRRAINLLWNVQMSRNKQALGFAFQYEGQNCLEVVLLKNQPINFADIKIIVKQPISYIALNYDASKIAYYLPQSKQLVLVEHQLNVKEQVYPCSTIQLSYLYRSRCVDPLIGFIALILVVLVIVGLLIRLAVKFYQYRQQMKTNKKQYLQNNLAQPHSFNQITGGIKLQNSNNPQNSCIQKQTKA